MFQPKEPPTGASSIPASRPLHMLFLLPGTLLLNTSSGRCLLMLQVSVYITSPLMKLLHPSSNNKPQCPSYSPLVYTHLIITCWHSCAHLFSFSLSNIVLDFKRYAVGPRLCCIPSPGMEVATQEPLRKYLLKKKIEWMKVCYVNQDTSSIPALEGWLMEKDWGWRWGSDLGYSKYSGPRTQMLGQQAMPSLRPTGTAWLCLISGRNFKTLHKKWVRTCWPLELSLALGRPLPGFD